MPMSHSGWAEWRRFSAAMLALVGAFNVVEGLVVIYDETALRVDPSRVLLLGLAGWAQVTLTLGALLFSLGVWLSLVTVRVRLVALSVVLVHALTQLGVLAAFPAWALLMISFDVVIIFALTATPAGAAASGAGTATITAGAGNARGVAAKAPGSTRASGRAGYGPGDRIGYRPRHEMAGAEATVLLSQLTDAVVAGMTSNKTAARGAVPGPRALPPAPPAAVQTGAARTGPVQAGPVQAGPVQAGPVRPESAGTSQPATATMVGAVAHTVARTDPAKTTGTAARGVAAPIIGAISGRWPDSNLQ